jgi:hypothetical protein
MNALDRYFRENLGDHSLSAPASAWDRVQEKATSPFPKLAWAAAAALLIVGLAGYYIRIYRSAQSEAPQAVSETRETPEVQSIPPEASTPAISLPDNYRTRSAPTSKEFLTHEATVAQVIASEEVMAEESVPAVIADAERPESPQAAEKPVKGIVIHFTLEPAEDAEPVIASGEPVVHAVGVGKMFEAAREFKDTDPYGRLRQGKDEIFALNFLNKKPQSTENEKHQ